LGGRAPVVAVTTIVGVGVPHAVDHRPEDADACTAELAAGAFDLREPAGIVPYGEHRAVGPSTHDQCVGDGEDGGESMMTRS